MGEIILPGLRGISSHLIENKKKPFRNTHSSMFQQNHATLYEHLMERILKYQQLAYEKDVRIYLPHGYLVFPLN